MAEADPPLPCRGCGRVHFGITRRCSIVNARPIRTLEQAMAYVRAKNRPGQIDGMLLAEIDRLHATAKERAMDEYVIWSHEHSAWWGPGGAGYATRLSRAGRYTRDEALGVCARAAPGNANRVGALPELPVKLGDLVDILEQYKAAHPNIIVGNESWV